MSDHTIRRATEADLPRIAEINSGVFLGDRDNLNSALDWATCWFKAYPLYQYFVVEIEGKVVGYAGWQMHGGFSRSEPVFELDQLGIDRAYQGQHLGPQINTDCIRHLVKWCKERDTRIESHVTFVVWAYATNFHAINVYASQFVEMRGFRIQFGDRAENMLRLRVPITMPVRD
ncbi:MAG TPA: GNAT family N-acetyltransferase [Candidatus Paceibacterota bacterium]|nr:GNAT family N-acetyltransferase [Candidatus Paceibacterota bacterium]